VSFSLHVCDSLCEAMISYSVESLRNSGVKRLQLLSVPCVDVSFCEWVAA